MRKRILAIIFIVASLFLVACGGDSGSDSNVIKVGATSVPHGEILEEIADVLKDEGIELVIETYTDYALPNEDLSRGELDANFFQHGPYLASEISNKGYDLISLGGVHVEPIGVYSKEISSIDEIVPGTEVIISRSEPDHGRILSLFEANGFITLAEDAEKTTATVDDIVDNPYDLVFSPDVNPEFLVEAYENETGKLIAINANYAIEADLSPAEDALFFEGDDSQYVNIVVARTEDKDNENLQKLIEILQSSSVADFINDQYEGEIIPTGGSN